MTIKKDSELGVFSLNEGRNRQIDEALAKNKEKAKRIGEVATPGLGDFVKVKIREARNNESAIYNSLKELINDQDVLESIELAYTNTEKLFGRIDLTTPTIDQFKGAGVNFEKLAEQYLNMQKNNLEPSWVLSPILPLTHKKTEFSVDWVNLYEMLTDDFDNAIENNPLKKIDPSQIGKNYGFDSYGIVDAHVSESDSGTIFLQELGLINDNKNIHSVVNKYYGSSTYPDEIENITWTLALISSTDIPQHLNSSSSEYYLSDSSSQSRHITMSQYMTLQANRIISGQSPLGNKSKAENFVHGKVVYDDGSNNGVFYDYAPVVYWDKNAGAIGVKLLSYAGSLSNIGVRLPFWG